MLEFISLVLDQNFQAHIRKNFFESLNSDLEKKELQKGNCCRLFDGKNGTPAEFFYWQLLPSEERKVPLVIVKKIEEVFCASKEF